MDTCKFCGVGDLTNFASEPLDKDSKILEDINIELWYAERDSQSFIDVSVLSRSHDLDILKIKINYCPICGKKLNE